MNASPSRRAGPQLQVSSSPTLDLLASAIVLTDVAAGRVRASVAKQHVALARRAPQRAHTTALALSSDMWTSLVGWVAATALDRDLPALLSETEPEALMTVLLGGHRGRGRRDAPGSEPVLWTQRLGPRRVQRALVQFARDFATALGPAIAAGHAAREEFRRTYEGDSERDSLAIARDVSGIELELGDEVERIVVAAATLSSPYVITGEHDDVQAFVAPIDGTPRVHPTPPGRLVRIAKAVGDESRLLALWHLTREPLTAKEVADRLSMPRTSAFHHVALLRESGLITVVATQDSGAALYRARPDAIRRYGEMLAEYLDRDAGDANVH